jgi:hypothetical protein
MFSVAQFKIHRFLRSTWIYVKQLQLYASQGEMVINCKYTNHQQMHKEGFIINRNTPLHVSTVLGHLQGELFCYRYTKVALYNWVRMCCWLGCFWRSEPSAGRDRREFTPPKTTQYTVNSTFSLSYKNKP